MKGVAGLELCMECRSVRAQPDAKKFKQQTQVSRSLEGRPARGKNKAYVSNTVFAISHNQKMMIFTPKLRISMNVTTPPSVRQTRIRGLSLK